MTDWKLLNASDYGVSQLRPRLLFVAMRKDSGTGFSWPDPELGRPSTVGERIFDLLVARGWKGAREWKSIANTIAPTIVGGSHKHGGPDLGPTFTEGMGGSGCRRNRYR